MEEKRKGGIKRILEGIARPFKALAENDVENDVDIDSELEALMEVQSSLKRETDYFSNIEQKDFIPTVETKDIKTKAKKIQKNLDEMER